MVGSGLIDDEFDNNSIGEEDHALRKQSVKKQGAEHEKELMSDENGEDDCSYVSLGDDMELNESIQELKKITAVPQLKNTDTLGNKVNRVGSSENPGSTLHTHPNQNINPVQRRLKMCKGDPYQVA